ncbi:MAG: hypothetical protein R2874_13405 [Desulfobacterales bacterium]
MNPFFRETDQKNDFSKNISELPQAVSFGVKGANRLRQTAVALGRSGIDCEVDGRPAPPVPMRKTFERLGATYIKIGQLTPVHRPCFSEEYVKAFHQCLDQTGTGAV